MRIASLTLPLLLLCAGACSLFSSEASSEYQQPNSLMADEIESRVKQIPFQHREELLQNLLWLAQTGETTIPAVLQGLKSENAKVRSSCAWVLGRMRDRRTIPQLQALAKDSNETVRLEVARTLVVLGDLKPAPTLIEGLDSDKKEVRFLCHEALKGATGRDFGFDHLSDNELQRRTSVLGWRQWWSEYSGDPFFAANYQQRYRLGEVAQPMGEVQNQQPDLYRDPMQQPQPGQEPQGQEPVPAPMPNGQEPMPTPNGQPQNPTPTPDGQPQNPTPTPDNGTPGTPPGQPNDGTPLPGHGDGSRGGN